MGGQDRVVWLNNRCRHLGSWVDRELELGLFTVIGRESLHEESTETRSSSTTERVEDKESLKTRTVVGETTDLFENRVDQLFTDSVVSSGVWISAELTSRGLTVVGGIFFSGNHGLGVEKTSVGTSSDLVNDIGFKIDLTSATTPHGPQRTHVKGSRDVLSSSSLGEESRESIILVSSTSIH